MEIRNETGNMESGPNKQITKSNGLIWTQIYIYFWVSISVCVCVVNVNGPWDRKMPTDCQIWLGIECRVCVLLKWIHVFSSIENDYRF